MRVCRATAAAAELDSLAAAIEARGPASSRTLAGVAEKLLWTPLVHPLRSAVAERPGEDGAPVPATVDRVVAMADEIRHGEATPEGLRAFAAELRAGLPEMRRTGWWPAVHGGAES